jgi:hypothetical protein
MSATPFHRDYPETAYRGALRARPEGARAALGMGAGASIILAAAALLIRVPAPENEIAMTETEAPLEAPAKIAAKASTGLSGASAALDIAAPEFENEKKVVAVRDAENGSARVDSLTIGQFSMGGTFVHIDIHPNLDAGTTNADFFLDMKNHAQGAGLTASRIVQRTLVPTRFGSFETADIRLSESDGAGERACLATRLVEPKASLEIAGIACGAAAKPIDRVALSCMLDKLSYSAGGDNKTLNDFFLNAELTRGKGCAGVSRDDLTASIPPQKSARANPSHAKASLSKPLAAKPAVAKPAANLRKKAQVAAHPAAAPLEAAKVDE